MVLIDNDKIQGKSTPHAKSTVIIIGLLLPVIVCFSGCFKKHVMTYEDFSREEIALLDAFYSASSIEESIDVSRKLIILYEDRKAENANYYRFDKALGLSYTRLGLLYLEAGNDDFSQKCIKKGIEHMRQSGNMNITEEVLIKLVKSLDAQNKEIPLKPGSETEKSTATD